MEEHVKLLFTSTDQFFVLRAENLCFQYTVYHFCDNLICLLENVIVEFLEMPLIQNKIIKLEN